MDELKKEMEILKKEIKILKRDTILNKSKNERLIINMEILNVELQDENKELKSNILINTENIKKLENYMYIQSKIDKVNIINVLVNKYILKNKIIKT